MVIDLSLPLYPAMPVYPGDYDVTFTATHAHNRDGYSVHHVSLGTHTGTHIDAPYHAVPDGAAVDTELVLSACAGDALVIDVTGRLTGNEILPSHLGDALDNIATGDRVLLVTGWSERFGTDDYYHRFPSLSEELADIFIERSIALLGLETPSLHVTQDDKLHRKLLGAGIVIVESLANLGALGTGRVFFSAAPLRFAGLDGSPVRAYAITRDR